MWWTQVQVDIQLRVHVFIITEQSGSVRWWRSNPCLFYFPILCLKQKIMFTYFVRIWIPHLDFLPWSCKPMTVLFELQTLEQFPWHRNYFYSPRDWGVHWNQPKLRLENIVQTWINCVRTQKCLHLCSLGGGSRNEGLIAASVVINTDTCGLRSRVKAEKLKEKELFAAQF